MAMFAELHDGRRLEFPDGTDPSVIQGTVRKLLAQTPAAPEGLQEGMGEAALIAAGRGTDKIVQGVRQAYNWATGDQKTLDKMAGDEAEKDRLYKPLREAHPVTTALGEAVPAMALAPLSGGSSLLTAGATAAIPSLLSYGSADDRLKRGGTDAAFGAAGALGGQVLTRLLKPAGVGAETAGKTVLDAAERVGFKPTPAQITNSPGMAAFENYLLRSPGSSGTMQAVAQANQTALNRAGAKAMGEAADTLDEGVFAAAKGRIGNEFERLSAVTKPQLGDDFINTLATIEAKNSARGPFASKQIGGIIDKGLDLAAKGNLEGTAYKEIRTELANQAQSAFKAGDATAGQAYKDLVAALDKSAKSSLSEADQKAWDAARQQWGAFKTLSKSNVAEAGNVSAARTAAAVRSKNPNFRAGGLEGELADIARVGEAFKGVANPTSGQLNQMMMYGNPVTGLPMMAANKLAASAYMRPLGQRYFSRGLVDVGETGRALLGRAGAQIAIPAGRGLLGVE